MEALLGKPAQYSLAHHLMHCGLFGTGRDYSARSELDSKTSCTWKLVGRVEAG
jgi:hypothetical protein